MPDVQRPLAELGRLYAFRDDAKNSFTFAICLSCALRLTKLPVKIQRQQERASVGNVARCPERYQTKAFDSWNAAYLYIQLETKLHADAEH